MPLSVISTPVNATTEESNNGAFRIRWGSLPKSERMILKITFSALLRKKGGK